MRLWQCPSLIAGERPLGGGVMRKGVMKCCGCRKVSEVAVSKVRRAELRAMDVGLC